jgi:hypothetical protein
MRRSSAVATTTLIVSRSRDRAAANTFGAGGADAGVDHRRMRR